MDRSLFPAGVEVSQPAMTNQTSVTAEQILQRFLDQGQGGVVEGFTVSVNVANNTQVDVAAGRGYAPGGEMTELTAAVVGKGLADYTNGANNFVCVIYTEVTSRPEAHAFDGTTRPTIATRSARVSVYTLTQLAALPATSSDMLVDSADRTLVVGVVNANGLAVPLLAGDITNAATITTRLLTAPLLTNVTGVEIRGLSAVTPTTFERLQAGDSAVNAQASLQLNSGAAPYAVPFPGASTILVRYRAPGDTIYGAFTALVEGLNTIPSSTVAKTLTIFVTSAMLPRDSAIIVTDNFDVSEMYVEPVQLAGARDEAHRRSFGDKLATPLNAHGEALGDLGKAAQLPWGIELGTGLLAALYQSLLPRIRATQSSAVASDRTLLGEFALNVVPVQFARLYLTPLGIEFVLNARYQSGSTWTQDNPLVMSTKFLVSGTGLSCFAHSAGGTWADTAWTSTPLTLSSLGGASGAGQLFVNGALLLGANLLGGAGRDIARIYEEYDAAGGGGNVRSLLFDQRLQGGAADEKTIRIYRATTTSTLGNTHVLEITMNALWNSGPNSWSKDSAAFAGSKIEIHRNNVYVVQRLAASAGGWVDSVGGGAQWDGGTFNFDLAAGDVYTNRFRPLLATESPPAAHALYQANVPKAYGRVTVGAAGPTLVAGSFNVASVIYAVSELRILFSTPFPLGANIVPVAITVGAGALNLRLNCSATFGGGEVRVDARVADTAAVYDLSAGGSFDISFHIMGAQ